ncbi:MAG: DUF4136 domain-containing protein, partial [Bacteroidota bacterium]
FSACAVSVKTYQKPDQSFDHFETWCWLKGCEITYQGPDHLYNKQVIDEIANAIAFNMYEKGYQQSGDSSDLVVNFYIVLKQDSVEIDNSYNDSVMPSMSWLESMYPNYYKFLRGSLVIDVIDRVNSELVWKSNAEKYLENHPVYDRDAIWADIEKAMKKLPEARSK